MSIIGKPLVVIVRPPAIAGIATVGKSIVGNGGFWNMQVEAQSATCIVGDMFQIFSR